jgi:hypothetical protein
MFGSIRTGGNEDAVAIEKHRCRAVLCFWRHGVEILLVPDPGVRSHAHGHAKGKVFRLDFERTKPESGAAVALQVASRVSSCIVLPMPRN